MTGAAIQAGPQPQEKGRAPLPLYPEPSRKTQKPALKKHQTYLSLTKRQAGPLLLHMLGSHRDDLDGHVPQVDRQPSALAQASDLARVTAVIRV